MLVPTIDGSWSLYGELELTHPSNARDPHPQGLVKAEWETWITILTWH